MTAITILSTLLVLAAYTQAQAPTTCPLLGPQWPSPSKLASAPEFASFTQTLEGTLKSKNYSTTSYSIGIFGASDPDLLFQYHHTTPLLANSTTGTTSVNADSVYRIGSISKLLTVFTFLIAAGDAHWSDPVCTWLPELEEQARGAQHTTPDWTEITLGDLAGQMGGLGRDYGLSDLAIQREIVPQLNQVLPQIRETEVPVCSYIAANGTFLACSEEQYLHGAATSAPIFPTAHTTAYSNQAYALLALALSRITGKPVTSLFDRHIVSALNLTGTSFTLPSNGSNDRAVIPGTPLLSGWSSDLGIIFTPAGGNFASTRDFATIGRAILNSHLLSPATTRRWLKPSSFVNDLHLGVGRPWEIVRVSMPNRTVDVYTKAGDWGVYHSVFALIPDYGVGFSVLTAADSAAAEGGPDVRDDIPNFLAEPLIAAVDEVAKKQAAANFAGTYTSSTSNSSLTLTTDDGSGLRLTSWINDGKDLGAIFLGPKTDWRLLPNDLEEGNKVGFTSFRQEPKPPARFFGPCFDWADVDGQDFGNVPLGQFVFDVDDAGKAVGVKSKGLRVRLEKQDEP